ncbi:hypothetical protein [Sediminibacillus massiliensis]|uniref:hypothetical protein n=1 Tax=Sediminibacillus massiliensis TaxID=1926277 RepID=UPI0009883AC2|nr:hypothetical protein [Sediminibacillus massiliensis]
MEIKLKIEAPGLEGAIHTLAQVLANYELPSNGNGGEKVPATSIQPEQPSQPEVPQQQNQQAPQETTVPVQQPQQESAVPVQQTQQPPVQPQQEYQQPTQQQQPVQPEQQTQPQPEQQQQGVPTSNPTYSMDQLAVAATQLVDAGKREELVSLLSVFGVQALTALPKEQYGAFATKLREMGAKI